MKQLTTSLSFIVLILVLSACSSNPSATPATLTGTWTGTWSSTRAASSNLLATTLVQNSSTISGTAFINGSPCLIGGTISGAIARNVATFGIVSGADSISFITTDINNSRMTGTYSIPAGECAGDTGTFALTKQ